MKTLKEIKREHIMTVLKSTGWDIKEASKILKVKETYLKREIEKMKKEMKVSFKD
ncbi:MAG: hypothetical protein N2513_06680 [Deltaproteobacteria bacterium]|nr:hypothetical protein [Deltaproteobacteria bacterium]